MLVAFQQVEDQLSALDALASEAGSQQRATDAADLSLRLTTNRFNAGAVSYLDVVTAQTIALTNRRTADQIDARQIEAEVGLLKALGGGWQAGTSVEHLIRNIDEFVPARVRRYRGKSTEQR
ncbi:RND transporter [Burkholderia contaminans]|nr:RND transporter [Burkholderia contaminans]